MALDWMSDSRIGVRPTMVFFSEVVLAVTNWAYSQAAAVRFRRHLRGQHRFDAITDLVHQMERDVADTRALADGW